MATTLLLPGTCFCFARICGGYSRVRHPKKARNSELKTEIVESLSILSLFFPPSPAFHSPMLGT